MKKISSILTSFCLVPCLWFVPNARAAEALLPVITSISPASGPSGTSVQIVGTNLDGVTAVKFNGAAATFTTLVGNLTAIVPAGATTGPISVTTASGTALSTQVFTVTQRPGPVITSFSPVSGKTGASVQIRGTNLIGVTSVKFNGVNATFTLFSGIVFATVPANASTGPITVTTSSGSFTTTEAFTVEQTSPPIVTDFSPASGEPGTSVQIQGANLAGVTAVKFNDVPAEFSLFGGLLLATVPTNAVTGPITIVTGSGSATTTTVFTVTKRTGPVITSFSPLSGEVGDSVEIRGTNLIDVTSVQFNGVKAVFTKLVSDVVFAFVPTNAASGPITVITPFGTNTTSQPFTVVNRLAPQITSLSPANGVAGNLIDVRGTNLIGVTSVKFNGVETEFLEFSSDRLLAFVPKNASSGPVTVITRAGTVTSAESFTITEAPKPVAPPSLSIRAQTQGQLELSWSTNAVGFVLQSTDELSQSTRWTNLDLPPATVQNGFVVTVRLSAQQKFFRLTRP